MVKKRFRMMKHSLFNLEMTGGALFLLLSVHCCDVTCAAHCFKSAATPMFVQQPYHVKTKRNVKTSIYWSIVRGNIPFTGDFLSHKERVIRNVCSCHDIYILYAVTITTLLLPNFHDIYNTYHADHYVKRTPLSDGCVMHLHNLS